MDRQKDLEKVSPETNMKEKSLPFQAERLTFSNV